MKKILGLFFLISSVAFGRELTLDEAINLSLENSKRIEISSKNMKIGDLNVARAFKMALPTAMYKASYARTEHTQEHRNLYERDTPFNKPGIDPLKAEKDAYTSQFVVSQPIFQGGAILGGIKGAKAKSNIMDLSLLKEKRDTRLRTIEIFSNITKYEKDLEALEISKKSLEIRYNEQKNKLEMKLIIKADLLKTEVALLEVESNIIQVKNAITVEMKKLRIETGISSNEDLELVPLNVPVNLSENINFDIDMVTAKDKSLAALIAKNNVKYAEAERMVAASNNLPKVNAFVQYGGRYERNNIEDTFHNEEWRGGVNLTWEFFNFGSGIDEFRAANEGVKVERLNDSIAQDNIEIALTTAYSEVLRFEKLRAAMKSSVEASEKNFEMDTERYKAGLISTQDFLNSEAQLRNSRVKYNKAESDYLLSFEKYRSLLI